MVRKKRKRNGSPTGRNPSPDDPGEAPADKDSQRPAERAAVTRDSPSSTEGTSPVPLVMFAFVLPFLVIVLGTVLMNRC